MEHANSHNLSGDFSQAQLPPLDGKLPCTGSMLTRSRKAAAQPSLWPLSPDQELPHSPCSHSRSSSARYSGGNPLTDSNGCTPGVQGAGPAASAALTSSASVFRLDSCHPALLDYDSGALDPDHDMRLTLSVPGSQATTSAVAVLTLGDIAKRRLAHVPCVGQCDLEHHDAIPTASRRNRASSALATTASLLVSVLSSGLSIYTLPLIPGHADEPARVAPDKEGDTDQAAVTVSGPHSAYPIPPGFQAFCRVACVPAAAAQAWADFSVRPLATFWAFWLCIAAEIPLLALMYIWGTRNAFWRVNVPGALVCATAAVLHVQCWRYGPSFCKRKSYGPVLALYVCGFAYLFNPPFFMKEEYMPFQSVLWHTVAGAAMLWVINSTMLLGAWTADVNAVRLTGLLRPFWYALVRTLRNIDCLTDASFSTLR